MKSYFFISVFLCLFMSLYGQQSVKPQDIPDQRLVTYFSFASDDFHNGPTFTGIPGNTITASAEVDLMVDLNQDNYGGQVTFQTKFIMKAVIKDHQMINIGSQIVHLWHVDAALIFYHIQTPDQPLLYIRFKEGLLTSYTSGLGTSPFMLGETMTLENSVTADPSLFFIPYPLLKGIGISAEHLNLSEDLAFTFTNVRSLLTGGLVPLDEKGNFKDKWSSEGSFSASAQFGRPNTDTIKRQKDIDLIP